LNFLCTKQVKPGYPKPRPHKKELQEGKTNDLRVYPPSPRPYHRVRILLDNMYCKIKTQTITGFDQELKPGGPVRIASTRTSTMLIKRKEPARALKE
jgi:hypothetical protein